MPAPSRRQALATVAAGLSLTAAGPATLAAQSASAAPTPAPTRVDRGLLDGLLGNLAAVLGNPANLAQLQALTSQLGAGALPSAPQLAPLTSILTQITTGDPSPAAQQLAGLTTLLGGTSADPVNAAFLSQIQQAVTTLAGQTSGDPQTTLTALAQQLTASISGASPLGNVAGLPVSTPLSSLPDTAVLTGLVTALQAGTVQPSQLGPVVTLLNQVAATPGLPAPVASAISTVATQLQGDVTANTPLGALTTPLAQLLDSIAATSGVSGSPAADVISQLTQLLVANPPATGTGSTGGTPTGTGSTTTPAGGGTATGPQAMPAGSAKGASGVPAGVGSSNATAQRNAPSITSLRYDKKNKRFVLKMSCAASAKGGCAALVILTRGTAAAATQQIVTVPAGASVQKTFKVNSAGLRALKKRATRFTLTSITSRTQIASRSSKVAKTAVAKKKAAKKRS